MQLWIVWRLEYIRGEISLIMMFHFLRKGNYMEQATIAGRDPKVITEIVVSINIHRATGLFMPSAVT